MSFQNVVVAGGGVLGTQIGFQAAYKGKNVTFWLRSEGSIGRTQPKLDRLKGKIPGSYSVQQQQDYIVKAVDHYYRYLQRQRDAR